MAPSPSSSVRRPSTDDGCASAAELPVEPRRDRPPGAAGRPLPRPTARQARLMPSVDVAVRPLAADDHIAVLHVLGASLGWDDHDASREYFAWKHVMNPFGPSPGWVAEVDGEVVGVRLF